MSVLIKGMEMPKTCLQCMSTGFRTAIKCTEWTELSSGLRETIKAPSCPLVEIPEKHGRLIDADALFLDIEWSDIEEAPTVIEAEGEG